MWSVVIWAKNVSIVDIMGPKTDNLIKFDIRSKVNTIHF